MLWEAIIKVKWSITWMLIMNVLIVFFCKHFFEHFLWNVCMHFFEWLQIQANNQGVLFEHHSRSLFSYNIYHLCLITSTLLHVLRPLRFPAHPDSLLQEQTASPRVLADMRSHFSLDYWPDSVWTFGFVCLVDLNCFMYVCLLQVLQWYPASKQAKAMDASIPPFCWVSCSQ